VQKNAFPSKESRNRASREVGRSVSSPLTPRDLWCVRWYGCIALLEKVLVH
jgi:hypothetical protein